MIEILSVNFDNYLSYGEGNVVDFTKHRVTILSAENGSGKSSLATVIEDALYSKNSKGILKADRNDDSFGLKGTIERIRYFCDRDDVFEIRSEEGMFTEVDISIPLDGKK